MKTRTITTALVTLLAGACTHHSTATTYGMPQEVARRLVGQPMVETRTASSVDGGYAESTWHGRRSSHTVGEYGEASSSVTRTHCVQAAEIDYVQAVNTDPVIVGRMWDVTAGVAILLAGATVYGAGRASFSRSMSDYDWDVDSWNRDNEWHRSDPDFFPHPGPYPVRPSEPGGTYALAAGIAITGAAYLAYTLLSSPRGTPAPPTRGEQRYTRTEYVEATGCAI